MISIIVIAHNKVEMTRRCLDAVRQSEFQGEWELLCVDNGSSESFGTLVKEFSSRSMRFRFLQNSENLSFSRANNLAVRQALGNRLIFLNNDLVVSKGALSKLIEVLEREQKSGIVGSRLISPENGLVQHAGMAQMLWGYASNFGVGAEPEHSAVEKQRDVFAVTGALMAIDRKVFETLDGFNERYWYGYEDVDICLKAKKAGYRVIYTPDAIGYHAESSTLRSKRSKISSEANYRAYREIWGNWLEAGEYRYLRGLQKLGVRKVVIFGTGQAAQGLFRILNQNGVVVTAFASSNANDAPICPSPIISVEKLGELDFDRLMVGSQYYFQVQGIVDHFDPKGNALFPALDELMFEERSTEGNTR